MCLYGARAFPFVGSCGRLLVAGGANGLRIKIRMGDDEPSDLGWNRRAREDACEEDSSVDGMTTIYRIIWPLIDYI